jgi:TP901 family phage tail tape measure protein
MAEQIVQTLGFDASGAISTINNLNQSLAQLTTNLNNVAAAARNFNAAKVGRSFKNIQQANPAQALNNAANAAQNMGNAVNQAGNQGGQALNNLNNKTKSLTLSWQTLSRIIIAQTIVRGINAITSAVGNAITETRELQKRISEIQTIAGGQLGSNADVFAGLQATAETFGFDILDVAEAKYQELSNQVEGSAESFEFQEAAAKLARATNSSLTDSVNLLSSVLNAFGKDATNSSEAAGLLFTTIEQGRIRAGELANTLGRVAPLANALGVDFNELGAALARVTQGGTRADTAITQILGILNKLSKPTEDLSAAFKELGVATAQQGIQQSGGLLPFLQRLQEVAGDNQALVEFFNNVRAIQGVLALLGTDAEKTGEVFGEFALTTEEAVAALENAFSTASQNDAVTYEKLVQQLNGTFRELATEVIPLINDALQFFLDTIDNIRANPLFTGALLAGAAGALVGVGAAATAAAGGFTSLAAAAGASLIAIGPAVLIFAAVAAAATGLAIALKQPDIVTYGELTKIAQNRLEELNKTLEESKSRLEEQRDAFKRGNQEIVKFAQQFGDLNKAAKDAVQDLNTSFVDSSTAALDSVLKSRQEITKQIQQTIADADKAIEKSQSKVTDLLAKKDDFLLNRRLKNLSELQQAQQLFTASQDQAFSARDLISGSTDLEDFDAAADILERRLDLAQRGLRAAQASGNRAAIAKAEQQVVTALNDQINLEKRRQDLLEQRKVAAEAAAAEDKAQTENLKSLVGDIKKELDFLNKNGQILNPEQLAAQEGKVQGLLDKLANFGLDSEQVDLGEFLGIQDLQATFTKQLDNARNSISEQRSGISGELQKIFDDLNAIVDDNVIEIAIQLGLTQGGPNQLDSLVEASANATGEIDNLVGAQQRFEEASARAAASGQLLIDLFQNASGDPQAVAALQNAIQEIGTNANIAEADVKKFFDSLNIRQGANALNPFDDFDLGKGLDSKIIEEARIQYDRLREARQKAADVEESTESDRARLEQLQNFQGIAQQNVQAVQAIIDVLGLADTAAGQIGQTALQNIGKIQQNSDAWGAVESAAKRAKTAVEEYSRAVREAPPPPAGGGGANSMFGGFRGPLFRAAGGFARGTDTIPAMLSPGEFVVNSRASKRFASQLIAMNAGVQPVYRQEGGPVVNNTVNVGDINVNGTANPDDTARRVVSQLRREFRRGTASRF